MHALVLACFAAQNRCLLATRSLLDASLRMYRAGFLLDEVQQALSLRGETLAAEHLLALQCALCSMKFRTCCLLATHTLLARCACIAQASSWTRCSRRCRCGV